MSEQTQTEQHWCRYPGCERRAEPAESGAGRPPGYCADPTHTRAAAWRARRRHAAESTQQPAGQAADEDRPVDAARERASALRAQVAGMIDVLNSQLTSLVEELRTTGDPDAAAAQIESVTAQSAEQVAAANARASRAEQAQLQAEAQAADADAAAVEATTAAETAQASLLEAQAEAEANDRARHEMTLARDEAREQQDRLHAERDALQAHLDTMTAQRDAARADVDREKAHADQRVEDVRATHAQQITDLRAELEQARHEARAERTRADRAEARLE